MRTLFLVGMLLWPAALWADVTVDEYCHVDGFNDALRQTVIIIDEHHIAHETSGILEANSPWKRFIGRLLDVGDATIEGRFAPRERVTIMVAAADGSGTRSVFTGCLPFFSADERREIQANAGWRSSVDSFFGSGPIARADDFARRMRGRLASALANAAQDATPEGARDWEDSSTLAGSRFVQSLNRGLLFLPANGIPRIILYSDLARFEWLGETTEDVRRNAREAAGPLSLDLQRSELFVVGVSGGRAGSQIEQAAHAFFLASGANLISLSGTEGIPQFTSSPVAVGLFQGRISYPQNAQHPMRMRLAVDVNGTVVNSWVGLQTERELYTPFGGVVTCDAPPLQECTFIGDRVFAQIWADRIGDEPQFEQWMSFAGLRELEMEIDGDELSGRAFDSYVDLEGVDDNALDFSLSRMRSGYF